MLRCLTFRQINRHSKGLSVTVPKVKLVLLQKADSSIIYADNLRHV